MSDSRAKNVVDITDEGQLDIKKEPHINESELKNEQNIKRENGLQVKRNKKDAPFASIEEASECARSHPPVTRKRGFRTAQIDTKPDSEYVVKRENLVARPHRQPTPGHIINPRAVNEDAQPTMS